MITQQKAFPFILAMISVWFGGHAKADEEIAIHKTQTNIQIPIRSLTFDEADREFARAQFVIGFRKNHAFVRYADHEAHVMKLWGTTDIYYPTPIERGCYFVVNGLSTIAEADFVASVTNQFNRHVIACGQSVSRILDESGFVYGNGDRISAIRTSVLLKGLLTHGLKRRDGAVLNVSIVMVGIQQTLPEFISFVERREHSVAREAFAHPLQRCQDSLKRMIIQHR